MPIIQEKEIMDTSLYVSCAAVLISLLSLGWSIHIGNRDRAKLLVQSEIYTQSNFYKESFPDVYYMRIKAVNSGRRPIILTTLWRCFSDKTRCGTMLGEKRLEEHEQFEKEIDYNDMIYVDSDGNVKDTVDLYLEDTLGRLYKIKNAKRHLREAQDKNKNKKKTI